MRPLSQVSNDLFEKLKNNFTNVSLGDKEAQSTINPDDAVFFNFDYKRDGKNLGNVTISLLNHRLQIFYSNNITDALDEVSRQDWFRFLKDLRGFAMRNMLEFDVRDISKPNLSLRDIKTMSQGYNDRYTTADVNESKMWGSTKSSYQKIGEVKMIVRHSNTVDETKMGARGRNVRAIYIENKEGERFKVQSGNLLAGRIIARHMSNGGQTNDQFTEHVEGMINELRDLRYFVRHNKNKTYEDNTTKEMVEAAQDYYNGLRSTLKSLKGQRGYKSYVESWKPDHTQYGGAADKDKEDLKERFIERSFNERLEKALPHIAKAYQIKVQEQKNLYETIADYIDGKKTFDLTNEDRTLFNLVEYKDKEALVKNVLESLAQKTKGKDDVVSRFAESIARNWALVNPSQKSLAVCLSKAYVKEASFKQKVKTGLRKVNPFMKRSIRNKAKDWAWNAGLTGGEMDRDIGAQDYRSSEQKAKDDAESSRSAKHSADYMKLLRKKEGTYLKPGEYDPVRGPTDEEYARAVTFANSKGSKLASIGVDRKTGDINFELLNGGEYRIHGSKSHSNKNTFQGEAKESNYDKHAAEYTYNRRMMDRAADEIDKIVKSGGRVGLNDPLSKKFKHHRMLANQIGKRMRELESQKKGLGERKMKKSSGVSKIDIDSAKRK